MKKKVSITTLIVSLILAVAVSYTAAWCLTTSRYKDRLADYVGENAGNNPSSGVLSDKLSAMAAMIAEYSYYEVSEEDLCKSIIGGYAYVKEDPYAYYFDEEEFAELTAENSGDTQGIGVTVIEDTDLHCIKIISVVKGSPAEKAGIRVNDRIIRVITPEDETVDVTAVGYESAVKAVQGAAGTVAKFTVARGADLSELVEFSIVREAFTASSVMYHVCDTLKYSKKIGVIKITGFDLTTPPQFCEAMDSLIADGCEYFLFDVRYNPGGDLASITAVLSYMLNKGDTVIITKDRAGNSDTTLVDTVSYPQNSQYHTCSVSKEDIGKYRSYVLGKSAVLTNGNTASAAELFTASLKDYGISVVVGTKTFGKGSMQTVFNLGYYGFKGALKLTTRKYFPPKSAGYDGIGIVPDVTVEQDEALRDRNIYDISDTEDAQLQAAIKAIK